MRFLDSSYLKSNYLVTKPAGSSLQKGSVFSQVVERRYVGFFGGTDIRCFGEVLS